MFCISPCWTAQVCWTWLTEGLMTHICFPPLTRFPSSLVTPPVKNCILGNLSITPDLYTQKKRRKAGRRKRVYLHSVYLRLFPPSLGTFNFLVLSQPCGTPLQHTFMVFFVCYPLVRFQNYFFFPPNYLNRLLLCAFAIPLSKTTPFSICIMNYDTHHKIRGLHCGKVPWPHFGDVPGAPRVTVCEACTRPARVKRNAQWLWSFCVTWVGCVICFLLCLAS